MALHCEESLAFDKDDIAGVVGKLWVVFHVVVVLAGIVRQFAGGYDCLLLFLGPSGPYSRS